MDVVLDRSGGFRIGVIGDLHSHWDDWDLAHFDRSEYDVLLFTGDLGGGTPGSGMNVAKSISRLRRPTLVMPGNNDAADIARLSAEFGHQRGLSRILGSNPPEDTHASSAGEARLCGYSLHRLRTRDVDVTVVTARPHSLGGPELTFAKLLEQTHGVGSIDESSLRLTELIDRAETEKLIFLSHNGPTGFGSNPADMWGCDFKPGGGDWGDPDLAHAIDYARRIGHEVLAVIAGHMHLRTKQGQERPWMREWNDTLYINAARVPRITSERGEVYRHHVSVRIEADAIEADEVFVAQDGSS